MNARSWMVLSVWVMAASVSGARAQSAPDDPLAHVVSSAQALQDAANAPSSPSSAPVAEARLTVNDLPPPSMGAAEVAAPLLKTFLMLAVVLGIAYLTLHKGLGKLVERQNAGRRVKVVERVALDTKRSLFVIEIDGKQMLIGGGEGGVVLLKDLEVPDAPAASQSVVGKFSDALSFRKPSPPPASSAFRQEPASSARAEVKS